MVGNILAYWETQTGSPGFDCKTVTENGYAQSGYSLKDLISPPSNHLHSLHGDRKGQWAISVSGAWRLCFRFENGEVFDLELIQYH